jgi:hypothetical protein
VATSTGLAAIAFILITILLDTLAGSIVGPVVPSLLKSLTGGAMAQMSASAGPTSPIVGVPFFVCAGLMICGFAVMLWSVNRTSMEPV